MWLAYPQMAKREQLRLLPGGRGALEPGRDRGLSFVAHR
jgi:hypothetical protein